MKADEPELLEAWRTVLLVCLSAKGKVRGTHRAVLGPPASPRPASFPPGQAMAC